MFWKRREGSSEPREKIGNDRLGSFEIEPGAPRPATLLKVADELEHRDWNVVELLKEVSTARGSHRYPVQITRDDANVFVEVETGPWDAEAVDRVLDAAFVLRDSEYAHADLELVSAEPVPEKVGFFLGHSAAALFQLDLNDRDPGEDPGEPEALARGFVEAARRRWDADLDYDLQSLSLTEELLLDALREKPGKTPILPPLVRGLGCYVGEILRRKAATGSWQPAEEGRDEEGLVLEIDGLIADPIGKALAFLENGPEDSVAFYAEYVLRAAEEEREAEPHEPEPKGQA